MRIYGPVLSRRFGLSLGIDIVPRKTCSFDCIYCQVGETDRLQAATEDFFPVSQILDDITAAIARGPRPDVLTFAGSGEPTLYRSLERLLRELREQTDIPILLITNGAHLGDPKVLEAIQYVDILAPSLDAGDAAMYARVNRPHCDISFEKLIDGLVRGTHHFKGEIRLEVMLILDVNDSEESLRAIAAQLRNLRFDQIDINTPVRPPVPKRGALPCTEATLQRAIEIFGPKARSIGNFELAAAEGEKPLRGFRDLDKDIRETLLRRPCTGKDLTAALGVARTEIDSALERLKQAGFVEEEKNGYFHARAPQ